jgi:hypothetical protein
VRLFYNTALCYLALGFIFWLRFLFLAVAQLFGFGILPLKINMLQNPKNNVLQSGWIQKL